VRVCTWLFGVESPMPSLQLLSGVLNAGQAALLTWLMANQEENISATTVLNRRFEDSSRKYYQVPISSLVPAIPWVSSINNIVCYLRDVKWHNNQRTDRGANPVRSAASVITNGIAVIVVATLSGILEIRTLVSLSLLCGLFQFVEYLSEVAVAENDLTKAKRLLPVLIGLYLILWVQIMTSFVTIARSTPFTIPPSIVSAVSSLFVLYSANLCLAAAHAFQKFALSFHQVETAHTLLDLVCRSVTVWSLYIGPVRNGDRLEENGYKDAVQHRATGAYIKSRVDFYLGESFCKASWPLNLEDTAYAAQPGRAGKMYQGTREMSERDNYEAPLLRILKRLGFSKQKFFLFVGDVDTELPLLYLVKNRGPGSSRGVILRCLQFERHWKNVYRPFPRSTPSWDQKSNKVFWRGTTTGSSTRPGNRFCLVETWFEKHSQIDIGFSFTCQGKDNRYGMYVAGQHKIDKFLEHRYLLSVEGNDKDSGINWKLASNSLVLMARPRVTSWLMETTLVPGRHYVLLKDDFSDLLQKWKWCESHQEECLAIVRNANEYMNQFKDSKVEERIEEMVLERYFAKIR